MLTALKLIKRHARYLFIFLITVMFFQNFNNLFEMSNSKAEKLLTKNSLTEEEIEIYKEFYDECDLDSDGFIDKKGS
jgi:hypothetical protein